MKNRVYIYFLLVVIAFALPSYGQKSNTNSLLWEISGNGLSKSSYLFGTYHLAGKDFIDTMAVVKNKIEQADAIVGELLMDKSLAAKLTPYLALKNTTLDKVLNPSQYELVASYFKKTTKIDLKLFNTFKPIAVQLTLLPFITPNKITPNNPALDTYIQDYGRTLDKEVIGLETVEEQANILFGQSLERQVEILIKSIKEEEKGKIQAQKLYQDYIDQNLSELETELLDTPDYTKEELDKLLKNRNENWLKLIPQLLKSKSLFIAVGAGHLLGKDGLIAGLKKLGYQLTPIATR